MFANVMFEKGINSRVLKGRESWEEDKKLNENEIVSDRRLRKIEKEFRNEEWKERWKQSKKEKQKYPRV